jgi:hypothetical protein
MCYSPAASALSSKSDLLSPCFRFISVCTLFAAHLPQPPQFSVGDFCLIVLTTNHRYRHYLNKLRLSKDGILQMLLHETHHLADVSIARRACQDRRVTKCKSDCASTTLFTPIKHKLTTFSLSDVKGSYYKSIL